MNVNEWLTNSTNQLKAVGVSSARLDALVLLEDVAQKDRSWLLAHPDYDLAKELVSKLASKVERRAKHEPLAYIRAKSEFYGREFLVTPDTLEPRPETETMIDLLKKVYKVEPCTVVDVGTGSGCIAITIKLEIPETTVIATEINDAALKIARQNAKKLEADVTFHEGNLLETVKTKIDILLCNLPYVPDSHTINEAAMFEPKVAIFGGSDGLDLYRELFDQIGQLKKQPSYILTESLPFQHEDLAKIAHKAGYKVTKTEDFIQVFRPTN